MQNNPSTRPPGRTRSGQAGNNKTIAGMFRQIAAFLQEQGVEFKPAAYRRAAQVIEELPKDVSEYGGKEDLDKLPAIGEGIAKKIVEYLETGKITVLDNLRASQGTMPAELMDIEGMGPKRARQVKTALKVNSVSDLIKAAEEGRLKNLPGFSELMERKILENAKRVKERIKRFPRDEVKDDVERLIKKVRSLKGVEQAEAAGSFRREKETVGDIDILVITSKPKEVCDAVMRFRDIRNVVAQGDKKLSFDMKSGLRVDIRFVRKSQWGAALLYFTGSKEHNIAMRKVAIKKGWKLNEYGLFQGDMLLAGKTEEEIYKKLGLRFYEPRERTDKL